MFNQKLLLVVNVAVFIVAFVRDSRHEDRVVAAEGIPSALSHAAHAAALSKQRWLSQMLADFEHACTTG